MIGRLHGVIIEKQPPTVLLDVNGVGYEIQAPLSTFYQLSELNTTVTLFTHFVVREDAQLLYGFYDKHERALFRALIKINGVGPKLALTILSGIETSDFILSIQNNDSARLVKLPGVGKKTAERLLIEMRDKLGDWADTPAGRFNIIPRTELSAHSKLQDAVTALITLGYKPQDASRMVAKLNIDELSVEEIIRRALKGTLACEQTNES